MKLKKIVQTLEEIAPLKYAENWDNVGLLINPLRSVNIKKMLLTIDLTEKVADEAIKSKCNFILTYHPILFRGANRLNSTNAYDRTVMKLISKNIAVYSPHTALDSIIGGVNDWLANSVGTGDVSVLQPYPDQSGAGQGRIVILDKPVALVTVTKRIKKYLGLTKVRLAKSANTQPIKTIALCAGAGTEAFKEVEADLFLTGEMSHHNVLAATLSGTHVILCEHTNTERGYLSSFSTILNKAFHEAIEINIAQSDCDPLEIV